MMYQQFFYNYLIIFVFHLYFKTPLQSHGGNGLIFLAFDEKV